MKKKLRIIILLAFIPLFSFSQETVNKNKLERSNYFFNYKVKDCSKAVFYAEQDIKNGKLTLYSSAGMIPRSKKESERTIKFMKKYKLKYSNFGCLAPNYKCVAKYNNQIFDYLTSKYGKRWMKKMDKYIIGFDEWKLAFNER